MAGKKGRVENLRPMKKGEKGRNPLGAGAHNQDLKAVRRLTHDAVAELGSMILAKDQTGLNAIHASRTVPALNKWMAGIILEAMRRNDLATLNTILDRIIGKVPEHLKVDSKSSNTNVHAAMDKARINAIMDKLESEV